MQRKRMPSLWTLTALAVVVSLVVPWSVFAYVTTDKPDYAPGETVTISGDNRDGAGYVAGETVHVDVVGPNGYTSACDGVADDNGAWSCQVILQNGPGAVGVYEYVATAQNVTEIGYFTDAYKTTTTLNAISTPLSPGQTGVEFSGQVTATPSVPNDSPVYLEWTSNSNCPTAVGQYTTLATAYTSTTDGVAGKFAGTFTAPSAGTYYVRARFDNVPVDPPSTWGASWSACQTIVVSANTPPTLNLPSAMTVEGNTTGGANVTFTVTASDTEDDPDPTPTCTPASGAFFTLGGPHTVNCSVTDSGGLTTSGSFQITVVDTTAPSLVGMPGDITVNATAYGGATVTYTPPTASDIVDSNPTVGCVPASGSFFSLGETTVTCTATDGSSNSKSDSFKITVVDPTAPVITYVVAGTLGNNGWYTSDVSVSWTVTDPESTVLIDSGCVETTINYDTAGVTLSCEAHSAGGSSSDSVTIKRDATPPTITAVLDRDPGGTGWYNIATGAPTVSFTCSDATSGLAGTCPADYTFGEGADQSYSQTIYDNAGNSASAGVSNIDVDLTAPSITASVSPAADPVTGWWNLGTGAPTVSFTCSDATSGLAGTCPADYTFGEGADQSYSQTIYDNAGNSASAGVSDIDVDLTAPSISASVSPARPASGWWNIASGAPTVTYTCNDGMSGVASCTAAYTFGEDENQTHTGTAVDNAGNSATATVSDIDVDLTAPSITIAAPEAGKNYLLNELVVSDYSCSDNTSGVDTCAGPVEDGLYFDTASVGTKSFTVSATDNAGNSASRTNTYYVKYATGGMCYGAPGHQILQPINSDGSSVFKQKSTVPAKFRVCDANGVSIGTPGVVVWFGTVKIEGGVIEPVNEPFDSTTPYTEFRWSEDGQQWIYNIGTKQLSANKTYTWRILLNDGSDIVFTFKLK